MDTTLTCPTCHGTIDETDLFCRTCGKNLHAKPPSMELWPLVGLFVGSFLLPPFGIFWGLKYIRDEDQNRKAVGFVAWAITIFSIVLAVVQTVRLMNVISNSVSNQIQLQNIPAGL